MSEKRHDGGPAFPRPASEFTEYGTLEDGNFAIHGQDGMSLLDWFAGQALIAIASRFSEAADIACQAVPVAEDAYRIAAAMIAEKSKRS